MRCLVGFAIVAALVMSNATEAATQELPRIGVLMSGSEISTRIIMDGLRKGLAQSGIADGSGVKLDIKYANGKIDQLDSLATELVKSRPAVLFTGGDQGASAVKRASAGQLPIVAVTCDALAAGLVNNLAHPGENLTGVTCINADVAAKRVEIMKDLMPSLSRLGVALNPSDKRMVAELREAERAGSAYSVAITPINVVTPDDIESGLALASEKQLGGVVFVFDAMTFFHRARLGKLAIERQLPTAFNFREYPESGGLVSYGPNLADMYRQSARHILKILRGEVPGEIPMEQPTHLELVINIKTAKALGLTVPQLLLVQANEIIE
jgi:putative tryptophan/tyrosine transport system substrate-binding protein